MLPPKDRIEKESKFPGYQFPLSECIKKQNKNKKTKENLTVAKETEAPDFPLLQDVSLKSLYLSCIYYTHIIPHIIIRTFSSLTRECVSNEFLTGHKLAQAAEGAAEPCASVCSRSDFLHCTSAVAIIQWDVVPVYFMVET